MPNNRILIISIISIVVVAGFSTYFFLNYPESGLKPELPNTQIELAPEVENVLQSKADIFRRILKYETIINEIKASNKRHDGIATEEIFELDKKFRSSEKNDEFVKQFLSNPSAKILIEFQETYPAFSEIFITDKFGLNVSQTNMTSDLYQADEDWWLGAYNNGNGKEYHGSIEFDESAQAEAISYYFPLFEHESNEVIGVAKTVISIAAIKLEL